VSVAVKICGLNAPEAVAAAVEGGAAYVGFVFYARSPRCVTPERAAELCKLVPSGIQRVGLFVDAAEEEIRAVLDAAPIDMLQLHGREDPDWIVDAKLRLKRPIMKAVAISGPEDVLRANRYDETADMLLFDAKPPRTLEALPGGNGLAFDWRLLAGRTWRRPWMLSGGLTTENVAEAVRLTGASSVDVSSGVESAPGEKDPAKIRAFLEAARRL
jgi:phosphoribosylanthranilate isomerase